MCPKSANRMANSVPDPLVQEQSDLSLHCLMRPVCPNTYWGIMVVVPDWIMGRAMRIWYLSPVRAAKVQVSLRICAVSPEPPLLAHTSSESRGTFRRKARSLAHLNGWACAVKICHEGMIKDTNSLDSALIIFTLAALKAPKELVCLMKFHCFQNFLLIFQQFKMVQTELEILSRGFHLPISFVGTVVNHFPQTIRGSAMKEYILEKDHFHVVFVKDVLYRKSISVNIWYACMVVWNNCLTSFCVSVLSRQNTYLNCQLCSYKIHVLCA